MVMVRERERELYFVSIIMLEKETKECVCVTKGVCPCQIRNPLVHHHHEDIVDNCDSPLIVFQNDDETKEF